MEESKNNMNKSQIDDDIRYQEYLQDSLLPEGWESVFDHQHMSEWVRANQAKLGDIAKSNLGSFDPDTVTYFSRTIESFIPKSKYDLADTQAIFRPLFDDILTIAGKLGVRPIREVELVTSTSISPTPFARPTAGTHQLFVGLGTSAFCNYWAKAYTAIIKTLASRNAETPVSSYEDLFSRLKADPSGVILAARLSLFSSMFGTLLYFGEVRQPADYFRDRMQLVQAMEVFILAHEYTHIYVEENSITFDDEYGLEYYCDVVGLRISREWGSKNDIWPAFCWIGGLLFFRGIEIMEKSAEILFRAKIQTALPQHHSPHGNDASTSHPPTAERIKRLIELTIDQSDDDQRDEVKNYLMEYDLISSSINKYILGLLSESVDSGK